MRKYFLWKSNDQDKSFNEDFNWILKNTQRAKIITLAVLVVCFIMSVYTLSGSSSENEGSSVFSSPKDKAVSKVKHYQKLNDKIIEQLEDEEVNKAIEAYKDSDEYFQEVVSKDKYLNENFNIDGISDESYHYVSSTGEEIVAEINENGEESPRVKGLMGEAIVFISGANSNLDDTLDDLGEDVL